MIRRSVTQNEPGGDLESTASSSEGSLRNPSSKLGRKSLASSIVGHTAQEETKSKFFPMIVLLMEMTYSYVEATSEIYSVYAMAGYTTPLEQIDAFDLIIKYRYIGAIVVLPVGIVCDSYIGVFFPILFLLCLLTVFMGLHAVISLPRMLINADTKLLMAQLTFPIFAMFFVVEPLKFVTISRAIMESNYFRQPRHFYALLVCAMNLGIGASGTIVYFANGSRYALCTVMFANLCLMIIYTAFHLVARKKFMNPTNKSTTSDTLGVVEKTLAAIICYWFKIFDRYVLRKLIFKQSSEITGDYRCFTLSPNTRKNARALVAIVLVTLPLIAALAMLVLIDALYYVQLSMFYYYPDDPFPLLSMKGYIFLLLFPLVEFYIGPSLGKWSRSEASRQLTMVGLGAMCVSVALCWSFAVHKVVRDSTEFWYDFPAGTGHVAITNCVSESVRVRSQFMNYIIDGDDGWVELPPFKTVTVLNVPKENTPFHFEYSSMKSAIYDEYFLPVRTAQGSWYLILPTGVFPFPPNCFRRNQEDIYLTADFYDPASVCVVCALTICNGFVQFLGYSGHILHDVRVDLVSLTGRGTNDSLPYEKILTMLEGEYTISSSLGGVTFTKTTITGTFSREDSYMVIVYEGTNETDWKQTHEDEFKPHAVEPTDQSTLIQTILMKTSPPRTSKMHWMYPTVVLHALTDVTYLVSLWMFLFTYSPDQIRATVFCFVKLLGVPAYSYIFSHGAMSLRRLKTMDYFYLATTNCFFMIIYFFAILFFIHKLFQVKPTRHGSLERSQRRSVMSPTSDGQKGQ